MEKNIWSRIGEKGSAGLTDVVIGLPVSKEIMVYPNRGKIKPPTIDPYEWVNDLVDHAQTFQSHMYYVGAHDTIIYRSFPTTFWLVAWSWYTIRKPNLIGLFKQFAYEFISLFT